MSYPFCISGSISSMHDRNTRLILFLFTARLSTALRTTNPNLLSSNPFLLILRKNVCVEKDLGDVSLTAAGSRYCLSNMLCAKTKRSIAFVLHLFVSSKPFFPYEISCVPKSRAFSFV